MASLFKRWFGSKRVEQPPDISEKVGLREFPSQPNPRENPIPDDERRNPLSKINIWWEPGFPEAEVRAARDGLTRVFVEQLGVVGEVNMAGDYSGYPARPSISYADLVERSRDSNGQIVFGHEFEVDNPTEAIEKRQREIDKWKAPLVPEGLSEKEIMKFYLRNQGPFPMPPSEKVSLYSYGHEFTGLNLMLFNSDMTQLGPTGKKYSFVFGCASTPHALSRHRFGEPASPQSIARLQHLAVHEIGHTFLAGHPSEGVSKQEAKKRGVFYYSLGEHCPDESCVMDQFLSLSELDSRINKNDRNRFFCRSCESFIRNRYKAGQRIRQ